MRTLDCLHEDRQCDCTTCFEMEIERLTAENEELKLDFAILKEWNDKQTIDIQKAEAENEKAKELLKELEWIENELGGWFCPICIGERLIGHKSDCKLYLAINGKEARK